MTYAEWQLAHHTKRSNLQRKLESWGLTPEQVIEYFQYSNMRKHQTSFCALYDDDTPCHDTVSLNCYLCACPHFVVHDPAFEVQDQRIHSGCSINSKFAEIFVVDSNAHCDCSRCTVPHTKQAALQHYEKLKPVSDSCSILETIRNWQLSDIFGRYKLF